LVERGNVDKVNTLYFYSFGQSVSALLTLRPDLPIDMRGNVVHGAVVALSEFITGGKHATVLPRSVSTAQDLLDEVNLWATNQTQHQNLSRLHALVSVFSVVLHEEVSRAHIYRLSDKGNLSIDHLIDGASKRYPSTTFALLDDNIKREIDEAGKCLACALYTASGFHILRSVEIGIKAYLFTLSGGTLPKNRNWGAYIDALNNVNAATDVVDVLRILKTKRNPLMHPQDVLDQDEAVDIFCLSQATTNAIVKEIEKGSRQSAFTSALAALPTT